MKNQLKELFSDMRDTRFPSFGEAVIAGLVLTAVVGIALANSIWGIVIAGIIVFVFIIEWRNPTL